MANPTTKQQLDASWDRLKAFVNVALPNLTARLTIAKNKVK